MVALASSAPNSIPERIPRAMTPLSASLLAGFLGGLLTSTSLPAPEEHPLWPEGVPGAPAEVPAETIQDRQGGGDRWVTGVHVPTISVVHPEPGRATGAAVVVCPGGGYAGLALDKEGHDIAAWLASRGIVGVVLKYRMPRPGGHLYGDGAPLADVERALELVRAKAADWKVDPERVGVLGFSAGGHLAASASTLLDEQRPDFTVLVYPVISMLEGIGHAGSRRLLIGEEPAPELVERFSAELQVSKETPPAFLVHTWDDGVRPENSLRYASACRKKGVPVELHLFERGGHGYGMRKPELPVGRWPELLLGWMEDRGLLAEGQ